MRSLAVWCVAWLVALPPRYAQQVELRTTFKAAAPRVSYVVFSPDGKTLAAKTLTDPSAFIETWDVATGQAKTILPAGAAAFRHAISPDFRTLAIGTGNGVIQLVDLATGKEKAALKDRVSVDALAFSHDGKALASGRCRPHDHGMGLDQR